MSGIIAELRREETELSRLRMMDAAKRKGRRFIPIAYRGDIRPSPEMHSIDTVMVREVPDLEHPGETKLETIPTTGVLRFAQDEITGEYRADILDSRTNRHFLLSHRSEGVVVLDSAIDREITDLEGKPWSLIQSRKDDLVDQRDKISDEIKAIEEQERIEKLQREELEKARSATKESASDDKPPSMPRREQYRVKIPDVVTETPPAKGV